jgi:ubiquinone/menaquinone biosynthesis C-methylase UbiE
MNVAFGVTYSAAAAAFDEIASSYDEQFTHTAIGRAQRGQVQDRLLGAFWPGSRILELNCGTGEDARFLAKRGRSVVACDASAAMISVAKSRRPDESMRGGVEYLQIATENLDVLTAKKLLFDGAFSNFSGLNCVADLKPVACSLAKLIRPQGRVLLCVWSRMCIAEVLWYLLRGQPATAFRRLSGKASARLGERTIPVFYPAVREVRGCFAPWFRLSSRRAIGLFVPPSYADGVISKHKELLKRLESLDRRCAKWPILRDAGDHMLLEFVRCNP